MVILDRVMYGVLLHRDKGSKPFLAVQNGETALFFTRRAAVKFRNELEAGDVTGGVVVKVRERHDILGG